MQVEVNGEVLEFPDGMSREQMASAINARYKNRRPEQQAGQPHLLQVMQPNNNTLPADFGPANYGHGQEIPQSFAEKQVSQFKKDLGYAPRAAGLMARSVIEGIGSGMEFLGAPAVAAIEYFGGRPRGGMNTLANNIGLPEPQNSGERILGEATKTIAGGGAVLKTAQDAAKYAKAGGIAQKTFQAMAARPDVQLASLAGAGLAGGTVKEYGGSPLEQTIAALVGGLVAPAAMASGQGVAQSSKNIYERLTSDPKINAKIDVVLDSAMRERGLTIGDLSSNVRNQLAMDMKQYIGKGDMSPDVVRRLIDYRATGLTPTAGPLTLDPGIVTRQKNLAKLGASSADPKLQQLSQIENANNARMIENVNALGANQPVTKNTAGQRIIDSVSGLLSEKASKADELWKMAKDTSGRSALIDPSAFTQRANNLLDKALLGGKLPADVRANLNKIAQGEIPLTVDVAEQFKTSMAALQRNTTDRAEKMAIGAVRQALDDAPLLPGQSIGAESIKAFNTARAATRNLKTMIEANPALKAIDDGIDPDAFVNTYIIGSGKNASVNNVTRLKNILKDSPDTLAEVKNYIAQNIKTKALNGATDETGKFSQSAYNKALQSIGDEKLKLFFSDKEYSALKALGRVASYEQFQPAGSAVNNSNTASQVVATILDRIGNSAILRKVPLGAEFVGNPVKSISMNIQAGQMTKLPTAAKQVKPKMPPVPAALAPFLYGDSAKQPSDDNHR